MAPSPPSMQESVRDNNKRKIEEYESAPERERPYESSSEQQHWNSCHHYPCDTRLIQRQHFGGSTYPMHHTTTTKPRPLPHPQQGGVMMDHTVALAAAAAAAAPPSHAATLTSPTATDAASASSFIPTMSYYHMNPYAATGGQDHWQSWYDTGYPMAYTTTTPRVVYPTSESSVPTFHNPAPPPAKKPTASGSLHYHQGPPGSFDPPNDKFLKSYPSNLSQPSPPARDSDPSPSPTNTNTLQSPSTNLKEPTLPLETIRTLLLEDLPSTTNPDLVLSAIQKLAVHCRQKPGHLIDAIRMGAHSLLLVAWKRWLQSSSSSPSSSTESSNHQDQHQRHQIVIESSRFLLDMVQHPSFRVLRQSVVKMGVISLVIESLYELPQSFDLHKYGFGILAKVLETTEQQQPQVTAAVSSTCVNPRVVEIQRQDADMVQQQLEVCLGVLNTPVPSGRGGPSGTSNSATTTAVNHNNEDNNFNGSNDGTNNKPDLCGLVLNAMMQFEDHASIQVLGCILLETFLQRCHPTGISESVLKPRLQKMGTVMTVSTALDMHQQSDLLQQKGLELLGLLSPSTRKSPPNGG